MLRVLSLLGLWMLGTAAAAADKVNFQLDWMPGGDKAPVYVGVQQGFFAAEGLEVKIAQGRGSTDSLTRLATGISDIGLSDISALLAARARDDVGVSAVMSVFSQAPHAFFTLSDSGVDTVAKVAGKRIATSAFTSSNVFLPLLLEVNHLDENDIRLIKADVGALGPMLITGNADLVISWVTDREKYQAQASEMGRTISMLPWYQAGMDIYATSLVASDRFLQQRPEVARRFMRAYLKAIAYTWAEPERAGAMVEAMVPEVDAGVATATILTMRDLVFNDASARLGLGALDPARLAETWRWVARAQDLDESAFDPETAVAREIMAGVVPAQPVKEEVTP
ncbi:ABC transporter substrate-binding protein [Parahaliea maris]|uniref:ABC transporter substrate-binding protein n=2 Tax=Parahaliea maris TaxID=2716870 RepID=A0A5C9A8I6_9GAMM|nr:ABC transporter substrate-binding protein [Parahaliea maris]